MTQDLSESVDLAKLVRGSVSRHVLVQTAPMIVGLTASTSVGILDAYFVGQLGPDALAAIGFVFPVHIALLSLGVGVMVGVNSCVARALGSKDRAVAEQRAVQGLLFGGSLGLVLSGLLLLGQGHLFRALNADGPVFDLILEYMFPYALGFPPLILSMSLNGVLRGQGEAVKSSSILIVVAATNLILDPLLIAGWGPFPAYGVAGAAYATVVAFALASAVGFVLVQSGDVRLRASAIFEGDLTTGMLSLARVGAPAAFSSSVNPMGLTVLTGLLATHGSVAVAAFGAAARVQNIVIVPLLALSSSIGPIVGQNWGARAYERSRSAWRFSLILCVGYGLVAALLLVLFRTSVGQVFTSTPAVLAEIESYLAISAWGFAGFGILIVTNGALNAIDRASASLAVSIGRVFAVMVPLSFLGSAFLGSTGVYAAILVANLSGAAVAYFIGYRLLKASA